eukprot:scaffold71517_cov55-Phaeocystis_antarctica.AAC.8
MSLEQPRPSSHSRAVSNCVNRKPSVPSEERQARQRVARSRRCVVVASAQVDSECDEQRRDHPAVFRIPPARTTGVEPVLGEGRWRKEQGHRSARARRVFCCSRHHGMLEEGAAWVAIAAGWMALAPAT